jgi:hypothetical protein
MFAPLLKGLIGKQVYSNGLGLSGVANLLMSQKDHVQAAMPSGLADVSSLLNFGSLGDFKGNIRSTTKEVIEESSNSFNWWP